jgi:hypothetical protein
MKLEVVSSFEKLEVLLFLLFKQYFCGKGKKPDDENLRCLRSKSRQINLAVAVAEGQKALQSFLRKGSNRLVYDPLLRAV